MSKCIKLKPILKWLYFFSCLYIAAFCNVSVAEDVPELTAWMIDKTDTLSSSQQTDLNQLLEEHEKQTNEQFIVLMIPSLNGESIEEYAVKVFKKWQLGQKDKDNGLLVVIAKNDRKLRIEVGYGLEGKITDAISGRIIKNDIAPYFKNNDYYGGINNGVNQLLAISNNNTIVATDPQMTPPEKKYLPEVLDLYSMADKISLFFVILLPLSLYAYVRFCLKKKIPYLFTLSALICLVPNVLIYYIAAHALSFITGVSLILERANFSYFFGQVFSLYLAFIGFIFVYYLIYQIGKRVILTILSLILSQDLVGKYCPSSKGGPGRSSSWSSSSSSSRPSGGGGRSGGGGASGGW